jgi:acyl carrier protein
LLWFFKFNEDVRFFAGDDATAVRELVRVWREGDPAASERAFRQLRVVFDRLGADSLDVVELVMEADENLG